MKALHETLTIWTGGKGPCELAGGVARIVRASDVATGTAAVFVRHTSVSLVRS